MSRSLASLSLGLLLLMSLLPACGMSPAREQQAPASAPAPAAVPAAPAGEGAAETTEEKRSLEADDRLTTVEEAEAALARAQAELDSALGPVAFAQPPPAAAPADAPARKTDRGPARGEPETGSAAPRPSKQMGESNCDLACRAFGSLSRAADAVCRLDDAGERCSRAKRVVADAQTRVSSCGCERP